MVNKLRKRVILYTVASVVLVLALLMGIINAVNYMDKDRSADEILYYLAENGGDFPRDMRHGPEDGGMPPEAGGYMGEEPSDSDEDWLEDDDEDRFEDEDFFDEDMFSHGRMTEETPFETRFFSVTLKDDGTIKEINTGKIAAVSSAEAAEMANRAAAKGKTTGYDGNYKYLISDNNGETLYIFLDCTRDLESVRSFLKISILVSLLGALAISLLVVILSPKMIRPVAESYAKQKEFITNAGHELKTPMTVIGSCTEVLEMQHGESKWTAGIKEQVKKLTDLTNHMVALAKMDEGGMDLLMEEVELSELVNEALEGFCLKAEHQGRSFERCIDGGISIYGNPTMLTELVSILADNALKYGSPDKPVSFTLSKR
ncbi:MAG: HAMP domain-containing histidine kinase, partial [Firmicutes bacterium]|nr:HAMP domain-containing histidine kinase [Bacillota bacterium]